MDHEAFARRILGMPSADTAPPVAADEDSAGLTVPERPCVRCDRPTDRVSYDPDTLELDPAFCTQCERDTWRAPVEFMVADEPE
jgi:hypothetical protein